MCSQLIVLPIHVCCAAVVLALMTSATGRTAETPTGKGIDGAWTVLSVEFAGQTITELKGATLVLADGKKVFRMPPGAVEQGTYTLDSTQTPKQIDTTTAGKPGVVRGIYALEGNTLRMCFAQSGGRRPAAFATAAGSDALLMVLERGIRKPHVAEPRIDEPRVSDPNVPEVDPAVPIKRPGKRTFRMGFTGFVPDITLPAVVGARKFVRENGDIIAHHIEGVPWAEALTGEPFGKEFVQEWEGKKAGTPPSGKVFLAISPGRGRLKVAEKGLPLPAELRGRGYDDPLVKRAYLNYCRRAVEFFQPDYLCIGIEVNEIHSAGADKWRAYVELHEHVYAELKKQRKDLPIFASFTLHNTFKRRGEMLAEFQRLMPYNDLVAVSYYPFLLGEKEPKTALDWMTGQFDRFEKPYAMVETNEAAEELTFPSMGLTIHGTPAKQTAYYELLLSMAQQRRFTFVISFIHQDYDPLWEKIKNGAPELFMAWRDCGLLDENGKPRPAYGLWRSYFLMPLAE